MGLIRNIIGVQYRKAVMIYSHINLCMYKKHPYKIQLKKNQLLTATIVSREPATFRLLITNIHVALFFLYMLSRTILSTQILIFDELYAPLHWS